MLKRIFHKGIDWSIYIGKVDAHHFCRASVNR